MKSRKVSGERIWLALHGSGWHFHWTVTSRPLSWNVWRKDGCWGLPLWVGRGELGREPEDSQLLQDGDGQNRRDGPQNVPCPCITSILLVAGMTIYSQHEWLDILFLPFSIPSFVNFIWFFFIASTLLSPHADSSRKGHLTPGTGRWHIPCVWPQWWVEG